LRSARNSGHAPDRLAAAADFLRDLPDDVVPNAKQRAKLAPLLLDQVDADGWDLGPELLRALSVSRDNKPAANRLAVVKFRIEHLAPPPRSSQHGSPEAASSDARCPHHPSRALTSCPCQTSPRNNEDDGEEAPTGPGRSQQPPSDALAAIKASIDAANAPREAYRRRRPTKAERTAQRQAEEAAHRELASRLLAEAGSFAQ